MRLYLILEIEEAVAALVPGDLEVRIRKSGESGGVGMLVPAADVAARGRADAIPHAASRCVAGLLQELGPELEGPL